MDIRHAIYEVVPSPMSDEFQRVITDIAERVDEEDYLADDYEAVLDAINDGLIYYGQQWAVLEHYCNPQDANWDNALDWFTEDVVAICALVYGEYDDE